MESPVGQMLPLELGQRWDDNVFRLPRSGGPSLGWHDGQFLLIHDPGRLVNGAALAESSMNLGIATHGPLIVLQITGVLVPGGWMESPRAWVTGMPTPEPVVDMNGRMVWSLAVVSGSTVTGLRMFTTSPQFTHQMRQLMEQQVAAGPISMKATDEAIIQWQLAAPDEDAAWSRCLITCSTGS